MTEIKKTSPLAIAFAWLVVGIPAVWGVCNTGLNAAKLFTPVQPAQAVTAPSIEPATASEKQSAAAAINEPPINPATEPAKDVK